MTLPGGRRATRGWARVGATRRRISHTRPWDYCVADKDSTANNTGYVTALIAEEHLHDGNASVHLCGPPPMVEAVRTHFSDNGFVPFGSYFEKFALSGTAASAPAKASDPEVDSASADASSAPDAPGSGPQRLGRGLNREQERDRRPRADRER